MLVSKRHQRIKRTVCTGLGGRVGSRQKTIACTSRDIQRGVSDCNKHSWRPSVITLSANAEGEVLYRKVGFRLIRRYDPASQVWIVSLVDSDRIQSEGVLNRLGSSIKAVVGLASRRLWFESLFQALPALKILLI